MYQPDKIDHQTQRDEVYVVVSGTGWFVNGESREPFEDGEVLFVPAGTGLNNLPMILLLG